MIAGIDFGITNTDIVIKNNGSLEYFSIKSEKSFIENIELIFKKINFDINKIRTICVTGGKSSDLPDKIKKITIKKINEIQAIGIGAKKLYGINQKPFVVVSAGTGTACVYSNSKEFVHLGGISVGGGTLLGLSKKILNKSDIIEIENMAQRGNRQDLDTMIGEAVNSIGNLHNNVTASNLNKAVKNFDADDVNFAASINYMIGEVIGTIAYLNAMLMKLECVYFVGRVSLINSVKNGIDDRLNLANVVGHYCKRREFCNAIGALESIKE